MLYYIEKRLFLFVCKQNFRLPQKLEIIRVENTHKLLIRHAFKAARTAYHRSKGVVVDAEILHALVEYIRLNFQSFAYDFGHEVFFVNKLHAHARNGDNHAVSQDEGQIFGYVNPSEIAVLDKMKPAVNSHFHQRLYYQRFEIQRNFVPYKQTFEISRAGLGRGAA